MALLTRSQGLCISHFSLPGFPFFPKTSRILPINAWNIPGNLGIDRMGRSKDIALPPSIQPARPEGEFRVSLHSAKNVTSYQRQMPWSAVHPELDTPETPFLIPATIPAWLFDHQPMTHPTQLNREPSAMRRDKLDAAPGSTNPTAQGLGATCPFPCPHAQARGSGFQREVAHGPAGAKCVWDSLDLSHKTPGIYNK